jgi:hypothetical protein
MTTEAAVCTVRQGREAAGGTRSGAGEAGTSALVRLRRAYSCEGFACGQDPRERILALHMTALTE